MYALCSSLTLRPRRSKKGPCDAMLGPAIMSAVGMANFGSSGDELAAETKFAIFSWVALSAPSSAL
jgi:hypothetical protein